MKKVTCYYTDNIERSTLAPIGDEAYKRGYEVSYTTDFWEKSQIGLYCSHQFYPVRAKFSAIMLHDLGQKHGVWPKFWEYEPWRKFDIGFLPGQFWADLYEADKKNNLRKSPKYGIYSVGWQKADPVFTDDYKAYIQGLKNNLNLPFEKTVLYAPSWENDGKQDEFVQTLKNSKCNLLIKQADWSEERYPQIVKNIKEMEALHQDKYSHVKVLDPKLSIMDAIAMADVLVSDESGVMIEALMLDVPSVAVSDWTIPDEDPPRLSMIPFDFVKKTTRNRLQQDVEKVLNEGLMVVHNGTEVPLSTYGEHWFENRGGVSSLIFDLIEEAICVGKIESYAGICLQRKELTIADRITYFFQYVLNDKKK
jgi:hypothetical protein